MYNSSRYTTCNIAAFSLSGICFVSCSSGYCSGSRARKRMGEVAPPYKDLRKLLVLATRVSGSIAAPISWHVLLHHRRPIAAGTQSSIMIVAWFVILAATSRASILQGHSQENITQPNAIGVAPSGNIAVPKAQCGAPLPSQLIDSCREAFDFLPDTGPVISFGQRALKGQVDHVMPFLIMSCKAARLLPSHNRTMPPFFI